jgi:hypothetical protein
LDRPESSVSLARSRSSLGSGLGHLPCYRSGDLMATAGHCQQPGAAWSCHAAHGARWPVEGLVMTAVNRQHRTLMGMNASGHFWPGHRRDAGRITCLCPGVNWPAIGAPARCTSAPTPSRRPGRGSQGASTARREPWAPCGPAGSQMPAADTVASLQGPAAYPVTPVTGQGHRVSRRWRVAHAGAASPEAGRPA